jgi:hypothetical protein
MLTCNRLLGFLLGLSLTLAAWNPIFAEAANPLKRFNSPIVKLEPEKGFFLITTDVGILWVQVEEFVKEYLKTLEVGDFIDVVVEMRSNHTPPILKSWKLSRSGSFCKIFDGKACSEG